MCILQTGISDCADMFVSLAQNRSVTGQAYTVGKSRLKLDLRWMEILILLDRLRSQRR